MATQSDLAPTLKQLGSLAVIGYAAVYALQSLGVSDLMVGWATAGLAGILAADRQTVPERSLLKQFWDSFSR
jgi:uncharacterized membrane protein (Fun14 family)